MMKIQHNIIGMCATNTYYAYDEGRKEGVIVDPAGDPVRIFEKVEKLGFTPKAILITHGHFDHILAVEDVRQKYGIPAYIGSTEEKVLHDPYMNLTEMFMGTPMTLDADVYLQDGEKFTVAGYKVKAIEVPGHTIGGMCYYFEEEGILFSGDTLFCESVGRSDLPGGSGSALCKSIKEKLFVLPDDTRVYPGHMEFTTIGSEKQYNPFCQ